MLLTAIIVLAVLLVVFVNVPETPRYAFPRWLVPATAGLLAICLLVFVLQAIAPGVVVWR